MTIAAIKTTPVMQTIDVDDAHDNFQTTAADLHYLSQEALTDTGIERMKRLIMQLQRDLSILVTAKEVEAAT